MSLSVCLGKVGSGGESRDLVFPLLREEFGRIRLPYAALVVALRDGRAPCLPLCFVSHFNQVKISLFFQKEEDTLFGLGAYIHGEPPAPCGVVSLALQVSLLAPASPSPSLLRRRLDCCGHQLPLYVCCFVAAAERRAWGRWRQRRRRQGGTGGSTPLSWPSAGGRARPCGPQGCARNARYVTGVAWRVGGTDGRTGGRAKQEQQRNGRTTLTARVLCYCVPMVLLRAHGANTGQSMCSSHPREPAKYRQVRSCDFSVK